MKKAFTITELLAVIFIIVLLAALLFPIFAQAKEKGKEAVCISNLRQVYVSWQLYRDSHDGTMPATFEEFATEKAKPVLNCPSDVSENGDSPQDSKQLNTKVGLHYLPYLDDLRSALAREDSNHGIVYCANHGQPLRSHINDALSDRTGLILRLSLDGSVHKVMVEPWCSDNSENGMVSARPLWLLFTDKMKGCPPRICEPLVKPCKHG